MRNFQFFVLLSAVFLARACSDNVAIGLTIAYGVLGIIFMVLEDR